MPENQWKEEAKKMCYMSSALEPIRHNKKKQNGL